MRRSHADTCIDIVSFGPARSRLSSRRTLLPRIVWKSRICVRRFSRSYGVASAAKYSEPWFETIRACSIEPSTDQVGVSGEGNVRRRHVHGQLPHEVRVASRSARDAPSHRVRYKCNALVLRAYYCGTTLVAQSDVAGRACLRREIFAIRD